MNWQLPRSLLTVNNLAWFGGFMLVFWAPFWSGARLPILLLLTLGVIIHARGGKLLPALPDERRWTTLFLLLFLPCLLSAFFSLTPGGSFMVCLVLLLHYWVGLALLSGLRDGGHARMALWVGLTLLFWSVDGIVQLAAGRDLFGVAMEATELRVTGPFGDNLHMGLFIGVMMPLLLWPLARNHPWTTLALFVFMGTVAFLAGARTNLVFTTLVAFTLLPRFSTWKHRLLLMVLCLAPLLSIPFSPVLQERVMQRSVQTVMKATDSGKTKSTFETLNHVLNGRLWIWEAAGNMVSTHPLVGVGPGAFDQAYPNYAHRADDPLRLPDAQGKHAYHAHHMYIGMAAENGLIGLTGLLACIFLVARWFRQASPPARDRAAPYLACLAVIAFPINSQPILFSGWWFPIVLLLLCGFLAALEEQTHSRTPGAE